MPPSTSSSPSLAIRLAYTLVGNAWLVVSTLVLGLVAAVVGWLPPRGDWMYRTARLWSRGLVLFTGIRVDAAFEELLPDDAAFVFMANHQSIYDIPVLITALPGQVRFLAKRSLFRIPIFGWSLHAGGFVPVDRGDRAGAKRTFDVAARRLAEGRSILLFPEETRSVDGALGEFKKGGFLLALKSGYPIVPVGIEGTLPIRPKGRHVIQPGPVRLRFGPPIPAADYGIRGMRELRGRVRAEIERLRE